MLWLVRSSSSLFLLIHSNLLKIVETFKVIFCLANSTCAPMDEVESDEQASSVEARDLMDLLMSGETLGLDDLMAFQRNN